MIRVGCCGYPVSVKKYQEVFNLVELNSTFYKYPRTSTVIKWRSSAPEEFEFTVKAHQDISHRYRLQVDSVTEPFNRMKEICHILDANILLIQTPASFRPDSLDVAERFFREVSRNGLTLVWETRGDLWERSDARSRLREVLEKFEVPHVTDPFRTLPVYVSGDVAYFRLHGLGERMYYYQYTNDELRKLYDIVKGFSSERVYILFNNLSMFEDALRFINFLRDGEFPSLTGSYGLDSVKAVIRRTRYPSSKSMLVKRVGWRLFEVEDGVQMRLSDLLRDIPAKTYENPDEVLREIERVWRR